LCGGRNHEKPIFRVGCVHEGNTNQYEALQPVTNPNKHKNFILYRVYRKEWCGFNGE
jgi:hypothetical protein